MSVYNNRIYDTFMAPLEHARLKHKRSLLLEEAAGDVLEIGFGTGANLPFYPYEQMDTLTLLDRVLPDRVQLKQIPKGFPVSVVQGNVLDLPFEAHTFDSVVFTLVFCSVADPFLGFEEIRRVLKPGGRIYFLEHVLPIEQPYKDIFNWFTPAWKKVAHNCHLNRDTVSTLQRCGFQLVEYHRFYKTSFVSGSAEKL